MEREIKRDHYLEQLIVRKHNGLIKIVTGIRRCGKSYLLRTLFKRHLIESGIDENHIVEMAFDLFDTEIRMSFIHGQLNKSKTMRNTISCWMKCRCLMNLSVF